MMTEADVKRLNRLIDDAETLEQIADDCRRKAGDDMLAEFSIDAAEPDEDGEHKLEEICSMRHVSMARLAEGLAHAAALCRQELDRAGIGKAQ